MSMTTVSTPLDVVPQRGARFSLMQRLALFNVACNPICIQHARIRLRPMPTLTWCVITISVVAFIFALTLFGLTERGEVDRVEAAKTALLPLIVVQGVLLMGMGTQAVATGIARERDKELLDYHRMSPMPPSAKIVGYLFGLPAREYLLFGLTLPFVAYAVWVSQVSVLTVLHFYAAFFSSVLLYHMAGLMAGMVSRRAWHSSFASLGTVVVLYLVLPIMFGQVGLLFFDYLTVRPTFYGMVYEELQHHQQEGWVSSQMELAERYRLVPFFGMLVNPTLFSIAVQAFGFISLYHVVRRKWVDASWHPFSKRFGGFFVFGLLVLTVGSLWPLLTDPGHFADFRQRLGQIGWAAAFSLMIGIFLVVSALSIFISVSLTSPTGHTAARGLRRAWKTGRKRPPMSWDAATGWPVMLVMLIFAEAGLGLLLLGVKQGHAISLPAETTSWLVGLAVLGPLVVIAFQGFYERFGQRMTILGLFVLWAMPVMVAVLVGGVFDHWKAALYIASPCPALSGVFTVSFIMDTAMGDVRQSEYLIQGTPVESHAVRVIWIALGLYAFLAALGQWLRWRHLRVTRKQEMLRLQARRQANPLDPAAD
ncbi:MAG: hypothetical protein AAGA25_04520 [Planctomycetota bacterium]